MIRQIVRTPEGCCPPGRQREDPPARYQRALLVNEPHLDRARAGSFGSVAAQYDRIRPNYPDALIEDIAALRPAWVLDVWCGTGRPAAALVSCGLSVLTVQPDEQMASVARGHAIRNQGG